MENYVSALEAQVDDFINSEYKLKYDVYNDLISRGCKSVHARKMRPLYRDCYNDLVDVYNKEDDFNQEAYSHLKPKHQKKLMDFYVLIVDDIYDSGYTMKSVIQFLSHYSTDRIQGFCLFGKENKLNVKIITDEIVDENLNVKNSGTDSSDNAATSLKNILMGTSPEKNEIQDDPPIKTQLDTSDEDEYDEVLIENIPFLVPKIYISLDDLVNKTHAKGERVIDLETQAKVFEYLKTNFSFDVAVNDPIELFDDETEEDKGEVVDLEDLDNGDSDKISVVKRIKNSLLMLARALTFKSYELAKQSSEYAKLAYEQSLQRQELGTASQLELFHAEKEYLSANLIYINAIAYKQETFYKKMAAFSEKVIQ